MPLRLPKKLPKILLMLFLLIFIIQIVAILWIILAPKNISAQVEQGGGELIK